ncbi:hypothetical protein LWI29_022575 [Acer saccharum]|uniref:Disease resistance N-terminal domain-containing protein n=1 Tax=Acer saccharum TaxID=4024 RepID=A0AA39SZG3_ACESA|nr:hypothetical protein LWI29_022575 [Acer saccharum]
MEGVTKWDPVRLKASDEVRQIYSNIRHIDQQVSAVSMVAVLEADLEQARARIQELETDHRFSKKLTDFLIDEAVFLGSVRQEVQWLKNELGWMQCYIASADEKQDDNPIVRKWLNDITQIAYDAEDVIDKFILQVHDEETKERKQLDDQALTRKQSQPDAFPPCPVVSTAGKSICRKKSVFCRKIVILHDMGKDIEKLKIRINDLSRIRELYNSKVPVTRGKETAAMLLQH